MLNRRDLSRIMTVLERIDAGSSPPNLSGAHGAFFRRYAAQRNQAVDMALELGIRIRRDGKLGGAPLGSITISPIDPNETRSEVKTPWGDMEQVLVLCPELSAMVVFRTWMSSASGRDALRILRTLEDGEVMRVDGDFLWSPPGTITAGTADFDYKKNSDVSWKTAPYIKATGDDLFSPAHTLELRRVDLAGRAVLAQFRCIVLISDESHQALAPCLLTGPKLISISAPMAPGQSWMPSEGELAFALAFREPWDDTWRIWRYEPATPEQAELHLNDWLKFYRSLNQSFAAELDDSTQAVRHALQSVGIDAEPNLVEPHTQPQLPDSPEAALATDLCRLIRIGRNAAPGRE